MLSAVKGKNQSDINHGHFLGVSLKTVTYRDLALSQTALDYITVFVYVQTHTHLNTHERACTGYGILKKLSSMSKNTRDIYIKENSRRGLEIYILQETNFRTFAIF